MSFFGNNCVFSWSIYNMIHIYYIFSAWGVELELENYVTCMIIVTSPQFIIFIKLFRLPNSVSKTEKVQNI